MLFRAASAFQLRRGDMEPIFFYERRASVCFLISQKWLQAHLEVIKDLLLVGLRNGDFVELNSCHEDRFATDRRQAFDDVAHCLSLWVPSAANRGSKRCLKCHCR